MAAEGLTVGVSVGVSVTVGVPQPTLPRAHPVPLTDIATDVAGEDAVDLVTEICRLNELKLKELLLGANTIINDPNFGKDVDCDDLAAVNEATEFGDVLQGFYDDVAKAELTPVEKEKTPEEIAAQQEKESNSLWQKALAGVSAVATAGGVAYTLHSFLDARNKTAELNGLLDFARTAKENANISRTEALQWMREHPGQGLPQDIKNDLMHRGNITPECVNDHEWVSSKLERHEQNGVSATLQGNETDAQKAVDDRHAAGPEDALQLGAAILQFCVAFYFMSASLATWDNICGKDGKLKKWEDALAKLVKRKEELAEELANFVPKASEQLGKGFGDEQDGKCRDGNQLIWNEITHLYSDLTLLDSDFQALKTEVVQETGIVMGQRATCGALVVSNGISAFVGAASAYSVKTNALTVATAVVQTAATACAAYGWKVNNDTVKMLEKFEAKLTEHIKDIKIMIQQCRVLIGRVKEHWKAYEEIKKDAISNRDQMLLDERARSRRLQERQLLLAAAMDELMSTGMTPELQERMVQLRRDIAADESPNGSGV